MDDRETTVTNDSATTPDATARELVPAGPVAPADPPTADPRAWLVRGHVKPEPHGPPLGYHAYEVMLPRALALPRDQLRPVNVHPALAVGTCAMIPGRVAPLRAKLAALPDFDMAALDDLALAGYALGVAHANWRMAVSPREAVRKLVADGNALRDTLQVWGDALARGGMLDARMCAELRRVTTGHGELAMALMGWVVLLRKSDWERIQSNSVLDDATLEEAQYLSERIIEAIGTRRVSPEAIAQATDIRQRMFTLAARACDEVRRGVMYLRFHHGDADRFAPSLYRKEGRRAAKAAAEASEAGAAGEASAAGEGIPVISAGPSEVTSATVPGASIGNAARGAYVDEVGHPDSNPFLKQ